MKVVKRVMALREDVEMLLFFRLSIFKYEHLEVILGNIPSCLFFLEFLDSLNFKK